MTDTDNAAQVIRELTRASAEPNELALGGYYTLVTEQGVVKIDLTGDEHREFPKRKTGTVTVDDVASFAHYYRKHADTYSETFANIDQATITTVLDAHLPTSSDSEGEFQARWGEHRLVLKLTPTLAWQRWTSNNGEMLGQQEFAEFLEENAADVAKDEASPVTAAELLEIAQEFQAHTKVTYKSGSRLQSGQIRLQHEETVDARAGDRGDIVIPSEFHLGIAPYEDCGAYRIIARFRYRISRDGVLTLGYVLDDPQRKAREAVKQIAEKVAAETGATVMQGIPRR
jgi:uncharacterized protein YfdQ (DUF2303 family)